MNKAKMDLIIKKYCDDFENNWVQEKYKWKDIKRFQDNYSINCTPDSFVDVLHKSFDYSSNLVASNHYYSANEILKLAQLDSVKVQEAINLLFDEDTDLQIRIKKYKDTLIRLKGEARSTSDSDGTDLRFISTLLFFRYPEKYIIYKYKEIKQFAEEFETGIVIKKGKINCILQCKALSDIVIDYLLNEYSNPYVMQLLRLYGKKMECSEYYHDTSLRVLAQNIIWYATAYQADISAVELQIENTIIEHGTLTESGYRATLRTTAAKGNDTIDYLQKAKENSVTGTSGEEFVFDYENQKLTGTGLKAYWKSKNDGDGFGYDIESYDENKNKIYIEVKTTNGPESTPFYITATELAAAEKFGEQYYLYRVYQENGTLKIAYYKGVEIKRLCNCPANYIVTY